MSAATMPAVPATTVAALTIPTTTYAGKHKLKTRPIAAFDGEGIEINGRHRYTLLTAVQNWHGWHHYSVRGWQRGLSTERCLTWLLALPWAGQYRPINCSFAFGYDVTCIVADLSEEQRTALHQSGWVVWIAPKSGRIFYLEYAQRHWFFVGEMGPDDALYTKAPTADVYDWNKKHPNKKWLRIDDTFGFSQVSFVTMLKEHSLCSPAMLDYIAREKAARATFSAAEQKEIERYNIAECALLIKYVRMLQAMCLSNDMRLPGWYGPGAMASVLLKKHGAKDYITDPDDDSMRQFVLRAASGGRIEQFMVGLLPHVHNGDIRSAYPHKATTLPNLKQGSWVWRQLYTQEPYSLWEVEWRIPVQRANLMPFPYRDRHDRIWYPASGLTVVHQCELVPALRRYEQYIKIRRGLSYLPDNPDERPLAWLAELAELRMRYKDAGDGRHIPLKLGMNSIPGKFWQHETTPGKAPPFQSFYAAGFITAATRAQVFEYVYTGGNASDVALIATDGVYTCEGRPAVSRGTALGAWEAEKAHSRFLLVKPGIYVTDASCNVEPLRRTRGFGRARLEFADAQAAWQNAGAAGEYLYRERRFAGVGACAGRGNFTDYGQWIEKERRVAFMPEKGIDNPGTSGILRLLPPSFPVDVPSRPYSPRPPQDDTVALLLWQDMRQQLAELSDQP